MIRTQVYLPDDLYREMRLVSMADNVKTSDLFRNGLRTEIKRRLNKRKRKPFPLMNMIAKGGSGGPKDLAINHDYYLYDEPYEGPKSSS